MQIFLKDHADLYYFSTLDQLKLLKGFDQLVPHLENSKGMHSAARQALIQMTLNTVSSSDQDLLNLMVYYNEAGVLDQNEYLLAELRQYIGQRFDYMNRDLIL